MLGATVNSAAQTLGVPGGERTHIRLPGNTLPQTQMQVEQKRPARRGTPPAPQPRQPRPVRPRAGCPAASAQSSPAQPSYPPVAAGAPLLPIRAACRALRAVPAGRRAPAASFHKSPGAALPHSRRAQRPLQLFPVRQVPTPNAAQQRVESHPERRGALAATAGCLLATCRPDSLRFSTCPSSP